MTFMADTVTLRAFDLSEALNGAILATSSTGDTEGKPKEYALSFQRCANTAAKYPNVIYSAKINKKGYFFNRDGAEYDKENGLQLFIVDTTINSSTGTGATRSDGDTLTISSLQPREHFANAALQALLNRIDNPLEIDETTIKLLAQKAYIAGAAMMNIAADYRRGATEDAGDDGSDSGDTSDTGSDTDTGTRADVGELDGNTEKLLYNIVEALTQGSQLTTDGKTTTTVAQIKRTAQGVENILALLKEGLPIKNPTDGKLSIEGAGIDYDELVSIGTGVDNAIAHFPAFTSAGALGKATLAKVREAVLSKGVWVAVVEKPEDLFDATAYPNVLPAIFEGLKADITKLVDDAIDSAMKSHIASYHTSSNG